MSELRERAEGLAAQILDDGYPFPRVHEWWADAAERLARDVVALTEALENSESRLVGLSADVSRLDYLRELALNRARRSERECNELERRARAAEAKVAVLREALEAVVDFEPGSMRDFNAVGAIRQIAADALEASLRDAGEATG